MLNVIGITPCEEFVKFLFRSLDLGIVEPLIVELTRLGRLRDALNGVEQLQETELCFDFHF